MANKKINVNGIAVVEGVSLNRIKYTAAELLKFAPTLKGKPILKDHQATTDSTIGLVTETSAVEDGKKVLFSGWIKNDDVSEKVLDGRITKVSIGAVCGKLVKESEDSDILEARDMRAMELSTTPTPGIQGVSLQPSESAKQTIVEAAGTITLPSTTSSPPAPLFTSHDYSLAQEAFKTVEAQMNKESELPIKEEMKKCPECDKMVDKAKMPAHMEDEHSEMQEKLKAFKIKEQKAAEELKMAEEAEVKKLQETLKVKEDSEAKLKEQLAVAEQKIQAIAKAERAKLEESYKALATAKKVEVADVSKMTDESIHAVIKVIEQMNVTSEKKDMTKGEMKDIPAQAPIKEDWSKYVIEKGPSNTGAFYATQYGADLKRLHR